MIHAVFLSWHDHRRSRELAQLLAVPFVVLRKSHLRLANPWYQVFCTIVYLFRSRSPVVIVQNPSLILTTIACAVAGILRKRVIQDLHSYFFLHIEKGIGLRGRIYRRLSLFCIRRAALTVVTNRELKQVVELHRGRALVLQDVIPRFSDVPMSPSAFKRVVFVCTYSADEPVTEVIEASRSLRPEIRVLITGRIPEWIKRSPMPENVVLTGFLSETDYLALLRSADAVMVLTTRENTLVCGAYEGLAFNKPLILSDTKVLREYFADTAAYVRNSPSSILSGIEEVCIQGKFDEDRHAESIRRLRLNWQEAFREFRDAVNC